MFVFNEDLNPRLSFQEGAVLPNGQFGVVKVEVLHFIQADGKTYYILRLVSDMFFYIERNNLLFLEVARPDKKATLILNSTFVS
jgi:hypothetical protein